VFREILCGFARIPFEGHACIIRVTRSHVKFGASLRDTTLARQADAHEALTIGEDGAAVDVVPGVALVLRHDRELHAVN
jgi:hypothetical protein